MSRQRRVDWVVMGPAPHFAHCERCGGTVPAPTVPAPISMVVGWMKEAVKLHRDCRSAAFRATQEQETEK